MVAPTFAERLGGSLLDWPRRLLAWLRRPHDETLAALLLGVAALATAWSGYQASLWSGIQAEYYDSATDYRTHAARAAEERARVRMVDAVLFLRWLEADAERRPKLAAFYETNFRPAFRPAFDAWNRTDSATRAATSPFEYPEYRHTIGERLDSLDARAVRAARNGKHANDVSDAYVFDTVLLAIVLFFAGAIRPLVGSRSRGVTLFLAAATCVWAISRLVFIEPIAP